MSSAAPVRTWLILAVMLTAEIMDLLDATIVNVAGPSLEKSLHAGPLGLQWVIGGYALTLGAGLILGGRLGDRYGRRPMFLAGLGAFTAASVLCAVAPTIELLIVFRLVQGAAGAMLLPQGLGLLRENLSPAQLGKAFAVFGPVLGLGGILGPVVGGALIDADLFGLGWRAVFLVNLPIGLAALVTAWRILPHHAGDTSIKVDLVGASIVVASSGLLVLPLAQGQSEGWPAWTWCSLAAAVAGFFVLTAQQRRAAAKGLTPLVTPTLFAKPVFTVGLAGIALFFAGLIGVQLVLTLFLQIGQGFSAVDAGLGNLPLALGTAVGGALSGAVLAAKLGRAVLQIGAAFQLGGALLLWQGLRDVSEFSIWQIVPGTFVAGVGSGLVIAALFSVILAAVADDEIGSASGVLSAVQSIGGSVGVAVFSSTFFTSANEGMAAKGFQHALMAQMAFLLIFFAITWLFPRHGRPDDAETVDANYVRREDLA